MNSSESHVAPEPVELFYGLLELKDGSVAAHVGGGPAGYTRVRRLVLAAGGKIVLHPVPEDILFS